MITTSPQILEKIPKSTLQTIAGQRKPLKTPLRASRSDERAYTGQRAVHLPPKAKDFDKI